MKELIKGANTPLAASGKVRIRLSWRTAPGELDCACFALDARERVLADDWFVFYNQPASPGGAIRLDAQRAEFLINLDALPATVRKCVFTATLNGGGFRAVNDATFIAVPAAGDGALFRLAEPVDGRSLLLAEIYHYHDLWKVRAKGEGLKLDLAALARTFGVDVMDDAHHAGTGAAGANTAAASNRPASSTQPTVSNPLMQPPAAPRPAPSPAAAPGRLDPAAAPSNPADAAGPPAPHHNPRYSWYEKITPIATALAILASALLNRCTSQTPVVVVQPPPAPPVIQQPAVNPTSPSVNPTPVHESPSAKSRLSR